MVAGSRARRTPLLPCPGSWNHIFLWPGITLGPPESRDRAQTLQAPDLKQGQTWAGGGMGDNKPDFTGIVALLGLVGLCVHMCVHTCMCLCVCLCVCTCACAPVSVGNGFCAHHSARTPIFLCICAFACSWCVCAGDCLCVPVVSVRVCAHACVSRSIFLWSLGCLCSDQP